ncbi:MAG: gluconate permease, partial [Planctomycetales bacterium]|nr:gluconate permease [Planctomycetales bacterium]
MFPLQIDPLVLLVIGMVTVVGGILVGRWHAFLALLAGAFLVATLSPAEESASTQIAKGFGDTCRNVGIVIGLAAVIGRCLLESRAAERIVVALRSLLGEQRAAPALVVSGFILGIPVYFDTVFYLLLPIARTLARQTKRNYLLYVLS